MSVRHFVYVFFIIAFASAPAARAETIIVDQESLSDSPKPLSPHKDFKNKRRFYGHSRTMTHWRSGSWLRAKRAEHEGWWWVVGDNWYLYPMQAFPYPDPYQKPLFILQSKNPQKRLFHVSPSQESFSDETTPPLEEAPRAPTFTDKDGRTCREYQSAVIIDGEKTQAFGTACLEPDGSWRVIP